MPLDLSHLRRKAEHALEVTAAYRRGDATDTAWCGAMTTFEMTAHPAAILELLAIVDAADVFSKRIAEIHDDPKYKGVWVNNMIHGNNYDGPTYERELAELNAALSAARTAKGEVGK